MKKRITAIIFVFVFVFVLGVVVGRLNLVPRAFAQAPSTTLQCNVVGPCSQFIVQVNSGRGMGRFQIYPVVDSAIPTPGTSIYSGNPLSLQFAEPDPRGAFTFSLSLLEP